MPGRVLSRVSHAAAGLEEWTLSNGVTLLLKQTQLQDDELLIAGFARGGLSEVEITTKLLDYRQRMVGSRRCGALSPLSPHSPHSLLTLPSLPPHSPLTLPSLTLRSPLRLYLQVRRADYVSASLADLLVTESGAFGCAPAELQQVWSCGLDRVGLDRVGLGRAG